MQSLEGAEQRAQRLERGLTGAPREEEERIGRRRACQGGNHGELEIDLPAARMGAVLGNPQRAALRRQSRSLEAAGGESDAPPGSGRLAARASGGEEQGEEDAHSSGGCQQTHSGATRLERIATVRIHNFRL